MIDSTDANPYSYSSFSPTSQGVVVSIFCLSYDNPTFAHTPCPRPSPFYSPTQRTRLSHRDPAASPNRSVMIDRTATHRTHPQRASPSHIGPCITTSPEKHPDHDRWNGRQSILIALSPSSTLAH